MIKEHFGKLCNSLPSDYKRTIKRLQQLIDLAEEDVILMLSPTVDQLIDPIAVNQRVLMHLFMSFQSCDQLLEVHRVLEDIVDPVDHFSVHNFQQGTYVCRAAPIMLGNLPINPSGISQNFYLLFFIIYLRNIPNYSA